MTTHQLVQALAEETGLTNRMAYRTLYTFAGIVQSNMVKGEKTQITGFGTFDLGKRAGSHGVNPITREDIQIPTMAMPRFRAGKVLKEAVRGA